MSRRLLVDFLAVTTLAALTACGRGGSVDSGAQDMHSAPVEMEVVSAADAEAEAAPVYDELLDPEFGCHGGSSLEYGLIDRPVLD